MHPYVLIILGILALRYLLEVAADLANLAHLSPVLPDEFKGVYDEARYRRSQEYTRERTRPGNIYFLDEGVRIWAALDAGVQERLPKLDVIRIQRRAGHLLMGVDAELALANGTGAA